MKRLCKNVTPEQELRICRSIKILLTISIVLLVGITVYDLIVSRTFESTRIAILCADVCILSANIINEKNAKAALAEANENVNE